MRSIVAIWLLCLLVTVPACPPNGPAPVIGGAVIDCLGENRTKIDAMLAEFLPLLGGGKVDWSAVYTRGKQAGKDVGACFVLELTNYYISGGGAKGPADAKTAYDTAREFRDREAGGATIRTRCKGDDGQMHECRL